MPPHDDDTRVVYDVDNTVTDEILQEYDRMAATATAATNNVTTNYINTDYITTNTANTYNEAIRGNYTGRTFTFPNWVTTTPVDWNTVAPIQEPVQDVDIVPRIRYEIDLKLEEFQQKLDRYLDRMFQILKEEYNLGISEEEFMKLIKEE